MNFLSSLDVIIDTKMQKVMDGVVTRKACKQMRTVTEKPVKPLWSSTGILKVLPESGTQEAAEALRHLRECQLRHGGRQGRPHHLLEGAAKQFRQEWFQ